MNRSQIWIFAVLLAGWNGAALTAIVAAAEDQAAAKSANVIASAGLDGHYRVGRWTGIRLAEINSADTVIQTRDGDGVRVDFKSRMTADGPSDWVYVLPGSEAAPLSVVRDGETILKDRLPTVGSPSRGPAMLPVDMPWTVVFGDPLGLDKIGKNELLRRAATVAVTVPESASDLPDAAIGYDAIDVMLVTGSGADVLSQLDQTQADAVVGWVKSGGRMVMTLGQSAPDLLAAAPWLSELLPFDPSQIVSINPSAIETYTATQTQLDSFDGIKLPRESGKVLVMGRTNRRTITPIASQFNVGFGTVVVVAADLDAEPFLDWPQRFDFVTAMTGDSVLPPDAADKVQSRRTAYDDLAGQLRMTLDQFPIRRGAGFSVIALILLGLIALIGPLDYLLINRVLGRPLLGWISFPVTAIAISGLLVWQSLPDAKRVSSNEDQPKGIQCNRVEFIDIDAVSDPVIGRGESINFFYTHDAGSYDVNIAMDDDMQAMATNISSSAAAFGYPGQSFGGIQIGLEDTRLPAYDATSDLDHDPSLPLLTGLPLAPRSSKGFFHRFSFRGELSSQVELRRRRGSELLQGELVNPLPVDLLDGMLIFRNWVYLLPTRFKAGGRVGSLKELRQKNFRWLLSRQQAIESSSQTEAWDPGQTNDLRRLAEVLMFHQAVGGTTYTQLKHEPLSHLDLSDALTSDRCILMGRLETSLTNVNVKSTMIDEPIQPGGETLSLLRVVLPVVTAKR
ncbi:hypothetical protein [Rubripirellula obstinata]|uniref:hypothetical protein n=1 Tax=Rubripirellula obstinata TaxID=406547 RepID=UPI0009FFCF22|nr:hypothetical protein [Rubripirellula obstinata]